MAMKLILLILPLCVLSVEFNILTIKRTFEVGRKVLNEIQTGRFIGCKYQELCPLDRSCYDDKLFGSCLNRDDEHNFFFDLSPEIKILLETTMAELWQNQFRWSDFYTQCFLQTIIQSSEWQTSLDISHCKDENRRNYKRSYEDYELLENRLNDAKLRELLEKELIIDRLTKLYEREHGKRSIRKKSTEEGINPKSNSKEAVSFTKIKYEDPQVIRDTLKVAKRPSDEWIYLKLNKNVLKENEKALKEAVSKSLEIPENMKIKFHISDDLSTLYFKLPHQFGIPASNVTEYLNQHRNLIDGFSIVVLGVRRTDQISADPIQENTNFIITMVICVVVLVGVILVLIFFCIQKFRYKRDKMGDIINSRFADTSAADYKDLFRVSNNKESALKTKQGVARVANKQHSGDTPAASSPVSTRSSTSSWTDDIPATTNMDIYTGHMILSYMEKHLKNKDMFQSEWNGIKSYEAEDGVTEIALRPENSSKNRFPDKIPYDKSRVILKKPKDGDYINASLLVDSDPRLPAYIAAQSPVVNTITDFWQMVWEQGVVVIINLTELDEKDVVKYWPKEGSEIYGIYEINLVSEHIWSDEYLVRNFYLKNLENAETKTVTQFHFFSWPLDKLPGSSRSILEFRRKVNKSYRSKSTPILIHCKDGCGRSGTYILLDLILNRVGKGLKEMDIAATLEHLRDQRMHLVNTEEQFGFVLNTISEEVNNILKILNQ